MEEKEQKPIDLGKRLKGEIELPTIDLKFYIGRKTKIATTNIFEGQYGYYVKVESEILDVIEGGKEPIKLTGSRIFGLQEDKDGNIGWGKDTNLGVFLKKMNCTDLKGLIGKEVIIQTLTSKKDDKDYLTFN